MPSAADFLDILRKLQIVKPARLDELARKLQGKNADQRALAQQLIQSGLLTPYQVNQLLQGRGQDLVLGSYIILERLGEGGMGQVFKARHQKLDRIVALKVIRKERLNNPQAVKRFRREIEVAGKLSHPNIVLACDADQVGDRHILVMEYVEGTDLNKLTKEKGPLNVDRACDYIRQAALGLQHACERGLVHRDIKPHNLLLAKDGTVKILDMGLARFEADDDDTSTMTKDGTVMGTLDYVSPEQAMNSHKVDIRADLYSLGCTFYQLLTGRVPFPGGTAMEKMSNHAWHEPPPVEQVRKDVPPGVAAVVRKLLAKKPEDRYQTPAELAAVLAGGTSGLSASLSGLQSAKRKRRRILVIGAASGLLLLLVVVAVLSGTKAKQTQLLVTNDAEGLVTNKLGMKFKPIPKGTFLMGSTPDEIERVISLQLPWTPPEYIRAEGPQHEVEISQPFYFAIHVVTRGQFRQFIKESAYNIPKGASRHWPKGSWALDNDADWESPGHEQDDTYPVVCVNWVDAMAFVKWLNEKHPPAIPGGGKAARGWQYALPTEAQWEYACRANTKTRYFCGASDDSLNGFANVADASFKTKFLNTDWARAAVSWDDGYVYTSPVGKFKPNAWGLYDMHGNVCQWCADSYDANYYKSSPPRDPPGPNPIGNYVLRGGSWSQVPGRCRSASRDSNGSDMRRDHYGFRVAIVR